MFKINTADTHAVLIVLHSASTYMFTHTDTERERDRQTDSQTRHAHTRTHTLHWTVLTHGQITKFQ